VKSIISLESGWTYSYVILGPNFEPSVITIPPTAQAMVEKIDRFGNVSTALDFIAFDKKIGGFGSGELRLIDDIAYDIFMANKGFALGTFGGLGPLAIALSYCANIGGRTLLCG
jgi:hypothetical protein